MKLAACLLLFIALAAACASIPPASEEDRTLAFGCADIVLIGRLHNGAFQPIDDNTDLLGHGLVSAEVQVRKVVRGGRLPSRVPITYWAHAYMRSDRDFMLVLRRAPDGRYGLMTAQLMSVRPKLAKRCE